MDSFRAREPSGPVTARRTGETQPGPGSNPIERRLVLEESAQREQGQLRLVLLCVHTHTVYCLTKHLDIEDGAGTDKPEVHGQNQRHNRDVREQISEQTVRRRRRRRSASWGQTQARCACFYQGGNTVFCFFQ